MASYDNKEWQATPPWNQETPLQSLNNLRGLLHNPPDALQSELPDSFPYVQGRLNATDTFTDLHTLILLNPQVQSFSWSRRRSKSQRVLALVAWLLSFCAFCFFSNKTKQLLTSYWHTFSNFFTPFSNSNIDFSSSEHLTIIFWLSVIPTKGDVFGTVFAFSLLFVFCHLFRAHVGCVMIWVFFISFYHN